MVGGAIAMATLELLLQKNVLNLDDVQAVLKTAQSSLVNAPTVQGSLDGARIIGEIKDLFFGRQRGFRRTRFVGKHPCAAAGSARAHLAT